MAGFTLLACLIFSCCLGAGISQKYALKGLNVDLIPEIPGQPDDILWKHNGNKVVDFNGQQQDEFGSFENRIALDWVTAKLTITDLRSEDSGDYDLEAYIRKKLHHSGFRLEVIDKVAKPSVSCDVIKESSTNISIKLLCSAGPTPASALTSFEWKSRGNSESGQELTVFHGEELDDEEYSCTVSNPLSKETVTYMAKDCNAGEDKDSSNALIACLVIFGIALILAALTGIFLCRRHKKACFEKGKGGVEKTPGPAGPPEHGFVEGKKNVKPLYTVSDETAVPEEGQPLLRNPEESFVRKIVENWEAGKFVNKQPDDDTSVKDNREADPDQDDTETTAKTVPESDSSGIHLKMNEADDSSLDKKSESSELNDTETSTHEQDLNVPPAEKQTAEEEERSTLDTASNSDEESQAPIKPDDEDADASHVPLDPETETDPDPDPDEKVEDAGGKPKVESDPHQVLEETEKTDNYELEKESSMVPKAEDSETLHEEHLNIPCEKLTGDDKESDMNTEDENESDSSSDNEETNKENNLSTVAVQPQSTSPAKPEEHAETHADEDDQHDVQTLAPEGGNKSDSMTENVEKEKGSSSGPFQEPQSPAPTTTTPPTKPKRTMEPPEPPHADQDGEEAAESWNNSDAPEEQPQLSSTANTNKDNQELDDDDDDDDDDEDDDSGVPQDKKAEKGSDEEAAEDEPASPSTKSPKQTADEVNDSVEVNGETAEGHSHPSKEKQ